MSSIQLFAKFLKIQLVIVVSEEYSIERVLPSNIILSSLAPTTFPIYKVINKTKQIVVKKMILKNKNKIITRKSKSISGRDNCTILAPYCYIGFHIESKGNILHDSNNNKNINNNTITQT